MNSKLTYPHCFGYVWLPETERCIWEECATEPISTASTWVTLQLLFQPLVPGFPTMPMFATKARSVWFLDFGGSTQLRHKHINDDADLCVVFRGVYSRPAMSGFKNSGTCSPGYWHFWTTFVPTHNFFTWWSSFCPQRSIQASRSLLETAFSTLPPLCMFTGRLRDVTRKLKWVMGR